MKGRKEMSKIIINTFEARLEITNENTFHFQNLSVTFNTDEEKKETLNSILKDFMERDS